VQYFIVLKQSGNKSDLLLIRKTDI